MNGNSINCTADWQGLPYYSLNAYFKNTFGQKIYKIAVDAGCTCPTRDGKLDDRGCIFCDASGSGSFAVHADSKDYYQYIDSLIDAGCARFNKAVGDKFVIYFQAFTNTYGDIDRLAALWEAALSNDRVVGVSIATRPDCLGEEVLLALDNLKKFNKFIWIEMGLQTIHDKTAEYIRRHFSLSVYDEACISLRRIGIPYIVHLILGLPGEDFDMMRESVRYVCESKPFGIKLQLLHVLAGTDLYVDYEKGLFEAMELGEYAELVSELLTYIDDDIVIHRITGDGAKDILVAPLWSGNKKLVLNTLQKTIKEKGIRQGSRVC